MKNKKIFSAIIALCVFAGLRPLVVLPEFELVMGVGDVDSDSPASGVDRVFFELLALVVLPEFADAVGLLVPAVSSVLTVFDFFFGVAAVFSPAAPACCDSAFFDFDALLLVSLAVPSVEELSAASAFFRDFFFEVVEVSFAL